MGEARSRKLAGTKTDDAVKALRAHARIVWEVSLLQAWSELERAKGRPEAELTWGNCIRETGVLVMDAHGVPVEDEHGIQRLDPSRGKLVPFPDSIESLNEMERRLNGRGFLDPVH